MSLGRQMWKQCTNLEHYFAPQAQRRMEATPRQKAADDGQG